MAVFPTKENLQQEAKVVFNSTRFAQFLKPIRFDQQATHILEDQCIEFSGVNQKVQLGSFLMRRVVVVSEDNICQLELITHDFQCSA